MVKRLASVGVRHANEDGLIKWILCLLTDVEQKLDGHWQKYHEIYAGVLLLGKLAWRTTQLYAVVCTTVVSIVFGELHETCEGCAEICCADGPSVLLPMWPRNA